jgi:predicted PurR-regulated permease PerM
LDDGFERESDNGMLEAGTAMTASRSTVDPTGPSADSSAVAGNRSMALTAIATVLVFWALYLAASLLVPIASAVLLSMMLAPPVQFLERFRAPRPLASGVVVLTVMALLAVGLVALAGPAKSWIERAPQSLQRIQQKLQSFTKPFDEIKKAADQLQEQTRPADSNGPQEVRVVRPALTDLVLLGSTLAIGSALSTTILLFFLLASGDVFLRKLVTVIPTFRDKKRAVDITRQIETDISFYLLSFTSVNVGLGIAMATVTALLGMPNPLLWGAVVAILNFVPYVGAIASMAILTMVGIQTFDSLPQALAAPALLLVLVAITAEVITPMVLGRGLLLNPVAIFIAIMLWGWLWGLVGVLLAVPLLASFKIICERVEALHGIAEFLTT